MGICVFPQQGVDESLSPSFCKVNLHSENGNIQKNIFSNCASCFNFLSFIFISLRDYN